MVIQLNASRHSMMKIQRMTGGTIELVISGRIEEEDLPLLEESISAEPEAVTLDLSQVSIVGRSVVQFLARCQHAGTRLTGCPAYILEWIAREQDDA